MAQHFLLSAKARTLSLAKVFRMGEDAACGTFCDVRWPETDGEPVCPRCGCAESYHISTRCKFKCVACHHEFSVTSGTIFASRKLSFTDLLAAIVLFHKLREAMEREFEGVKLDGVVEMDGAYFGGHMSPENQKKDRKDRRLAINQTGKRKCVVVMRERNGHTLPFVVRREGDAVPMVRDHVHTLATIHADEASSWDDLNAGWQTWRINHSEAYSLDGACTNQAESYFSRLRRMEVGTHHHIAGPYLGSYAREAAWREDNRRVDNGGQAMKLVFGSMVSRQSRSWTGYWQRAD